MRAAAGLGALLGLMALTPKAVLACTCAAGVAADPALFQPPPALAALPALPARSDVFVATALWVDGGPEDEGPGRQRVALLPEASWRAPAPDTVSLVVSESSPCANYLAGGRYLVFAEGGVEGLTTGTCDVALALSSSTASEYLAQLGPPAWIATSLSDHSVPNLVPPDEVPTDSAVIVRVHLGGFPSAVTHVELAGDTWTPGTVGRHGLRLPPGIYAGRVRWRGGQTTHIYVGVRCEEDTLGCASFRFVQGLDVRLALESR